LGVTVYASAFIVIKMLVGISALLALAFCLWNVSVG